MEKIFANYISNDGEYTLYGLPATEELAGRTACFPDGAEIKFGAELAVKCDNDLFLTEKEGKVLLIEELPDESLKAIVAESKVAGAAVLPEKFEGWETDLSFASGYVLTAAFKDGTLVLRPSPEPVVANPYEPSEAEKTPDATEDNLAPAVTFPVEIVEIREKQFILRFPETGEIVFFDERRFLLYALLGGRIVTGFVELPFKD